MDLAPVERKPSFNQDYSYKDAKKDYFYIISETERILGAYTPSNLPTKDHFPEHAPTSPRITKTPVNSPVLATFPSKSDSRTDDHPYQTLPETRALERRHTRDAKWRDSRWRGGLSFQRNIGFKGSNKRNSGLWASAIESTERAVKVGVPMGMVGAMRGILEVEREHPTQIQDTEAAMPQTILEVLEWKDEMPRKEKKMMIGLSEVESARQRLVAGEADIDIESSWPSTKDEKTSNTMKALLFALICLVLISGMISNFIKREGYDMVWH